MQKAGRTIGQLAQERRNKALQQFGTAGVLVLVSIIVSPRLGALGILVVLGVGVYSWHLIVEGCKFWKMADRAEQGAKGEEIVGLLLKELEQAGWKIQYNLPIPRLGDADVFLSSPKDNHFVVDVKSHSGEVFFENGVLKKRFGNTVYSFEKDFLAKVMQQALTVKTIKGLKFVTPILCFTEARLDIGTVNNKARGVYVMKKEALVKRLVWLDSRSS